jgi:preprotein translocase subunit SecG
MIFQAVVSIVLIIVVLLQFGKGAEAGLFSGGGDSIMTGSQQGNILVKITIVLSILFMGNSILLAKLQGQKAGSSILDGETPIARPLNSDAQAAPTKAPVKAKEAQTTTTPKTDVK